MYPSHSIHCTHESASAALRVDARTRGEAPVFSPVPLLVALIWTRGRPRLGPTSPRTPALASLAASEPPSRPLPSPVAATPRSRALSMPLDLALEEHLDELDPLRHLREDAGSDEDGSEIIVPVQPPSIRNQTIELAFPAVVDVGVRASSPVTIKLAVDASPGCGGIAWPAGEVRARAFSHLRLGRDEPS